MKKIILISSVLFVTFFIACRKDDPKPGGNNNNNGGNTNGGTVTTSQDPGKGNDNGSSGQPCSITYFYDTVSGGHEYFYNKQGKLIRAIKLDNKGKRTWEYVDYVWDGDKLTQVEFNEVNYKSTYVHSYAGDNIVMTQNTNNLNSLKYTNLYYYDGFNNLTSAVQIQGNEIDSVAYGKYVGGRPDKYTFFSGKIVTMKKYDESAADSVTFTGHAFTRRYFYTYEYDQNFNRTATYLHPISTDGKDVELGSSLVESATFDPVLELPFAYNVINYGGFKNPNPNNIDRDRNIVRSKKELRPNSCNGNQPLELYEIAFDTVKFTDKGCVSYFRYKIRYNETCSQSGEPSVYYQRFY